MLSLHQKYCTPSFGGLYTVGNVHRVNVITMMTKLIIKYQGLFYCVYSDCVVDNCTLMITSLLKYGLMMILISYYEELNYAGVKYYEKRRNQAEFLLST